MTVCLGIIFFMFTIITLILGIVGCIKAADAVNKDEDSDAEIQGARIILDAMNGWTSTLPTEI